MISKIEAHRYTLKPRAFFNSTSRPGALVRVTFSDLEQPGVADLFPWRDLGDPALETSLAELATKDPSSVILKRVIEAARDEAEALVKNEPLLNGAIVNHHLATDVKSLATGDVIEARRAGAVAIKVKIGVHDSREEAETLGRLLPHWGEMKLRLDANERLDRESLLAFLDRLPILLRERVEFIEDPIAYDPRAWSELHRETGLSIAYDRASKVRGLEADEKGATLLDLIDLQAAQVLIHKPAWQDDARAHLAIERGLPCVVTSILGHPVGNLWAARKAFEIAPQAVHGCRSHVAYRDDEASTALMKSKQIRGARMVGEGTGLGLQSKWWTRLKWETLS